MKKTVLNATSAILLLIFNAHANETSSTLNIQVNVQPYCEMSVGGDIDFGTVSVSENNVAQGSIHVKCTKTTPYSIEIEPGVSSPSDTERYLLHSNGQNKIGYQLYQTWNGSSGKVWGTEISGNSKKGFATGLNETHTITGVIKAEQARGLDGDYTDFVRVLVKY